MNQDRLMLVNFTEPVEVFDSLEDYLDYVNDLRDRD